MTQEEALKIAPIIREAHCVGCTRRLCEHFEELFPEYNWFKMVADLNPVWWTEKFLRQTEIDEEIEARLKK